MAYLFQCHIFKLPSVFALQMGLRSFRISKDCEMILDTMKKSTRFISEVTNQNAKNIDYKNVCYEYSSVFKITKLWLV